MKQTLLIIYILNGPDKSLCSQPAIAHGRQVCYNNYLSQHFFAMNKMDPLTPLESPFFTHIFIGTSIYLL